MKRKTMALLVPPLAVCRYGCASCCAAPIAVFWITGIIGLVYGYVGGPAGLNSISWITMLLGATLWVIAAVWAENTIRGVAKDSSDPKCQQDKSSNLCRIVKSQLDESDPLDEVKKFHRG